MAVIDLYFRPVETVLCQLEVCMGTNASDKLSQAIELLSSTSGIKGVEKEKLEGLLAEVKASVSPDSEQDNYEAVVRQMITREDELTNQRMLWMAAFNGLLFAALGFAWDKSHTVFLSVVFSILGITTSILNGLALSFASRAQRRLLLWWQHRIQSTGYSGPGVMGGEPLDPETLYSFYVTPWILLAVAFAGGWSAVLWFVLTHIK